MACPFFFPEAPDVQSSAPSHAMLPLGDAWSGECRANRDQPCRPPVETLYPICNLGYARSRCPHFPGGDAPDAVRFAVRADSGSSLEIYYVVERDHLPVEHGAIEYLPQGAADTPGQPVFRTPPSTDAVGRLARAYVSSYFRRKAEAAPR